MLRSSAYDNGFIHPVREVTPCRRRKQIKIRRLAAHAAHAGARSKNQALKPLLALIRGGADQQLTKNPSQRVTTFLAQRPSSSGDSVSVLTPQK
jgi:hypothetical protein